MTTPIRDHPLPFIKGAYWFDNSTINDWCECPREYEYATLFGRVNAFNRAALNYGKGIHQGLAALVANCGSDYSKADLDKLDKVLETYFDANPQPPEDHRQYGLARETLRRYVREYEVEDWKVLAIDNEPVLERMLYTKVGEYNGIDVNYFCLLDLAVEKSDGYWVVDRKTTSRLGEDFKYDQAVNPQMSGYMWMFEQCFGVKPRGYTIDAIRTLSPSATAIKGGTTSLNNWWREQFARYSFYNDADRIAEWRMTLDTQIEELYSQFQSQFFRTNRKLCVGKYGRCQYYDVCTLPREQRPVALNSNNFIANTWVKDNVAAHVK